MNYKVGDRVVIINRRGIGWNLSGEMDIWQGKVMTISEETVIIPGITTRYKMIEDGGIWAWDNMDIDYEATKKLGGKIMDAVKMLKEKSRLTQNCKIYCTACRLGPGHNGRDINCTEFQHEYPEECVKIIEQWSKDCPKQTYLSKLLEVFPDTVLQDDGTPFNICPSELGLKDLKNCSGKCIDCWNQEWEV